MNNKVTTEYRKQVMITWLVLDIWLLSKHHADQKQDQIKFSARSRKQSFHDR